MIGNWSQSFARLNPRFGVSVSWLLREPQSFRGKQYSSCSNPVFCNLLVRTREFVQSVCAYLSFRAGARFSKRDLKCPKYRVDDYLYRIYYVQGRGPMLSIQILIQAHVPAGTQASPHNIQIST